MSRRIHDDEPDTSEPIVRALLAAQCRPWSTAPLDELETSGTDNAMWRIRRHRAPDLVVRLPRRPQAAAGVEQELAVLQHLERSDLRSIVKTPSVCHVGQPHDAFPHRWSVLEWIDGSDAWSARADLDARALDSLARNLGRAVGGIGAIDDLDLSRRRPGSRGGPLPALLERLHGWLDNPEWRAPDLIDVAAVRRRAAEALDVVDEPITQGVTHGDLIPGNLLVDRGQLVAIIDWGGVGFGDPAQDFAPAWSVFPAATRAAFRHATGADDAAWIRARTIELEHAVGGVLYYRPRGHPLGQVMARTLDRILRDR